MHEYFHKQKNQILCINFKIWGYRRSLLIIEIDFKKIFLNIFNKINKIK